MRYRVNRPDVINETIEGETVMINLASGNYYTLDEVGGEIWNLVADEAHVSTIVDDIAARYAVPREEVDPEVQRLLRELQNEALIVATDGEGASAAAAEPRPANPASKFQPPVLAKYTDMQDLVLLDPVHEVDERGWPHAKPSA